MDEELRRRYDQVEQAAKVLFAAGLNRVDFTPGFDDIHARWRMAPSSVQTQWESLAHALADAGLLAGIDGRGPWKDAL